MKVLMLVVLIALGLAISQAAPQRQPAGLYDDVTGTTYNQHMLASMANRDVNRVPRIEMLPGNETPMADRRMFKEMLHGNRQPSHVMGPWMKYSQTYWNPFIFGGPNGPPTFHPYLGVWPTYPQEAPEWNAPTGTENYYVQGAQGYDVQGPEVLGQSTY